MTTRAEGTIEDLYRVPENGKAEIVDGEVILMPPTGDLPASAGGEVFASLREFGKRTGLGRAYTDNVGFIVNLPSRRSFSPYAAFYTGPRTGGNFLEGAPVFAVEIRSKDDYGPRAEQALAQKRADYLAAGTLVVWDVDVLRDGVVRVYRSTAPETPTVYSRGQRSEAEPAVPGWSMLVDDFYA
jgi:Uma2 family endonuclease